MTANPTTDVPRQRGGEDGNTPAPDPRRRIFDLVQRDYDTLARLDADDIPSRYRDAAIGVTEAQAELPRLERRQREAERYAARGGAA